MKWLKVVQVLLFAASGAYVFLPVVHDNFPSLFFILLPLILVIGPVSARAALRERKRKDEAPERSGAEER
ncbi:hypothetical protein [Mitsuaria sp. GD03876]|uniref:hypothetical protein n=1 Tax=Mitsuaria sp. GD03876 TaxID=2975399 RepID=UPI00244B0871|nr:hypothetical protein [Mitsuaria sp. GD03876]MDH0864556.1 hypothetical protein [Mitsuaria sp. GD03876]